MTLFPQIESTDIPTTIRMEKTTIVIECDNKAMADLRWKKSLYADAIMPSLTAAAKVGNWAITSECEYASDWLKQYPDPIGSTPAYVFSQPLLAAYEGGGLVIPKQGRIVFDDDFRIAYGRPDNYNGTVIDIDCSDPTNPDKLVRPEVMDFITKGALPHIVEFANERKWRIRPICFFIKDWLDDNNIPHL